VGPIAPRTGPRIERALDAVAGVSQRRAVVGRAFGLSLVAQWLMARKRLENWHFWIAVDIVAIGVYLYKGLYLTSGLYAIFLVLCILGIRNWLRLLNARASHGPAAATATIA